MRKNFLLALAAAAVLTGAGCSSITTNVDFDTTARFDAYRTYAFKDVHEGDAFQMKRVQAAIDRSLQAKGLTKADGKPDLWVVLHTRMRNQRQVTTFSSGWGWGWGWRGGYWNTARVDNIPVGTLVVDLVDTTRKELVWRGLASRVVDRDETPQERTGYVQEAVDKLFAEFPPKR
ncbi:MAG TPA: DUF4136 domain-containing protein [Thermoanaerobaculia bacterium]